MQCPTCKNELTPTLQGDAWCTLCERAVTVQDLPRSADAAGPAVAVGVAQAPAFQGGAAAARQLQLPPFVLPAATLLLLGAFALFLGRGDDSPEPVASAAALAATPAATDVAAPEPAPSRALRGLAGRLEEKMPARNEIERARNATVFIKTPWGVGSGFFVDDDCRLLTNRHVVDPGQDRVQQMQDELYAAEQQIRSAEKALRQKNEEFRRRCRDCSEAARQSFLGADLARLENFDQSIRDRRNEILDLQHHGTMTATLADGSEHRLETVSMSAEYDLAMLRVPQSGCPALRPGNVDALELGQPLYTVGSPRGLRHKVTSGVFSGFVEQDLENAARRRSERVIQTDAPINPGNSGGPLIDKGGAVVGINSAILRNSEGIGLAIPIDLAFSEFGL